MKVKVDVKMKVKVLRIKVNHLNCSLCPTRHVIDKTGFRYLLLSSTLQPITITSNQHARSNPRLLTRRPPLNLQHHPRLGRTHKHHNRPPPPLRRLPSDPKRT